MPRRQPIPLLRTIGPIQATVLVVQEQWLQAPKVTNKAPLPIRSDLFRSDPIRSVPVWPP